MICTAPKTSTGTAIAIRKALEFLFAFGFCKCFIYSVFVTHIIKIYVCCTEYRYTVLVVHAFIYIHTYVHVGPMLQCFTV